MKINCVNFAGLCGDAFGGIRSKILRNSDRKDDSKVLVHVFANNEMFGGLGKLKGNTQEENLIRAAKTNFDKFWAGKDKRDFYPIDEVADGVGARSCIPYKKLRAFVVEGAAGLQADDLFNIEFIYIFLPAILPPCLKYVGGIGKFMFEEDREIVRQKIRMLISAAVNTGCEYIITSYHWGAGEFAAAPLAEMKLLWDEVLLEEGDNEGAGRLELWFCNIENSSGGS